MSTLRDVAKKAGVSTGTVSRILSNDENFKISDEKRKAVLDAVDTLSYLYKPKKHKVPKVKLGVILAVSSEKYGDPFFNTILGSIEKECTKHNFSISIIKHYNELNSTQALEELFVLKLDGLFLLENIPSPLYKELKLEIPHLVGIDSTAKNYNNVGFDIFSAHVEAMEYLIDCGFKKIAYFGGGSARENFNSSPKVSAYYDTLRKHNIRVNKDYIYDTEWDVDICAQAARKLLQLDTLPEVIFAGSDTLAAVILSVAYELGIKVPQDISVLGFNNIPSSAISIPALSTVDIPTKKMGEIAVTRMKDIIEGDKEIYNIALPTKIIKRNSIKEKN